MPGRLPAPLGRGREPESLDLSADAEQAGAGERWQDAQRQLFRTIVDALPDMVYLIDPAEMRFLYANEAACRTSGYSLEEHLAIGPDRLLETSREELSRQFDELIARPGEGVTVEFTGHGRGGGTAQVEVHHRALALEGRWVVLSVSRNISQRKRAERAVRRMSRMYETLSATNEAILHAEHEERLFDEICAAAVASGGFACAAIFVPDEEGFARCAGVRGLGAESLAHARLELRSLDGGGFDRGAFAGDAYAPLATAFATGRAQVVVHPGGERPWPLQSVPCADGACSSAAFPLIRDERMLGVLLLHADEARAFQEDVVGLLERMARNVAFALANIAGERERRAGEERIAWLASHDPLTGLPNRASFDRLLEHAVASSQRYARPIAVVFLDLDRFKLVNDTLGHAAGDRLLVEIAARIRGCLRESDVLARISGDEFVMLVQEVEDEEQLVVVARRFLAEIMRPVNIQGYDCRVTGSLGIARFPGHARDAQGLLKSADLAMYQAKDEGRNGFHVFDTGTRAQAIEKLELEASFRGALERGELAVHYQPKLDIRSKAITGVEALLRWTSPRLGEVPPTRFLSLAEETGLIIPLGRWVLRQACGQGARWASQGLPTLGMAVNLSARQFGDPALPEDIADALEASGLAPGLLELEIPEAAVVGDPQRCLGQLEALRALGVRLTLDNFGTAYSSLTQLRQLPVDTIKLDRSFIRDLASNADNRAITDALIGLGRSVSLRVVAEGVETVEQLDFLRARSCDELQGRVFSKALPPEKVAELFETRRAPVGGPAPRG